ncbi:MAG: hypothetical protein GX639_19105 [Fibrobacter sp.]|nr:hypothetical protein [Fibrobacter sp.]
MTYTCLKCNYTYDSDIEDCPCGWSSDVALGYELASISDVNPELKARLMDNINTSMSAVLSGPGGTGKTHSAISVVKSVADERRVLWDIVFKDDKSMDDRFFTIPLLVIDELSNNHWELLNARIISGLPTVCTTNQISVRDGIVSSQLDSRFTDWRLDVLLLNEPVDRKWVLEQRKKKRLVWENWNNWFEENSFRNILGDIFGDEPKME